MRYVSGDGDLGYHRAALSCGIGYERAWRRKAESAYILYSRMSTLQDQDLSIGLQEDRAGSGIRLRKGSKITTNRGRDREFFFLSFALVSALGD